MKRIITAIIAIILGGFMVTAPVFAEACTCADGSKGVKTAILGDENHCSCDNGSGSSVVHIFKLVINILSAAVGIVAAIGITIVGIQYLTAGGSEEKTRKAKRRMFEIVIGIIIYVLLYALLDWLLPAA